MATIDRGVPLVPRVVGGTVLGAVTLLLVIRLTPLSSAEDVQSFVLVFSSIAIEALPFVLLGALISAVIEVFASENLFARLGALPLPFQVPAAALGGIAFPVCECGSVPVARRLLVRGLHPAAALAFMFSSPIVNPLVLWSTFVAYDAGVLASR